MFKEKAEQEKIAAMELLESELRKEVKQDSPEAFLKEVTPVPAHTITFEQIKQYIQNFEGGKAAFEDSFETWVDTIQTIHPTRFRPIALFGSLVAHRDAVAVFTEKKITIGEFRDLIRMPENARATKLHELQIDSADFNAWRHEFTITAMTEGLTEVMRNQQTLFEDWARFAFAATKISEQQLAQ
jgi:hypothetical protein